MLFNRTFFFNKAQICTIANNLPTEDFVDIDHEFFLGDGMTPLYIASRDGSTQIVSLLLMYITLHTVVIPKF